MPPLKILITGGSGKLGQYLNIELSRHFSILTLHNANTGNTPEFNNLKADVTNFIELKNIFDYYKPDIVIHTAALANPAFHGAEYDKPVYDVNVRATENIAKLCEMNSAKLIYTSTDLVYAGYRGSMLKEDAKTVPASLYAETKLMGELKIHSATGNYIILRTALLFGFGLNRSLSHFDLLYKNLNEGKESKLFTDQFRTPLSLHEAARVIGEICKTDIQSGIINFGGINRVSRFEMGQILCRLIGGDERLLIPSSMNDFPNYPAVADVSMDTSKLQSYGIKQLDFEEATREIIKNRI